MNPFGDCLRYAQRVIGTRQGPSDAPGWLAESQDPRFIRKNLSDLLRAESPEFGEFQG